MKIIQQMRFGFFRKRWRMIRIGAPIPMPDYDPAHMRTYTEFAEHLPHAWASKQSERMTG